jgi:hypothetical protein
MPSPAAGAAGFAGAVGDADGSTEVLGAFGVQALSKILPAAVEPKIKISRRLNFLVIIITSLLRIYMTIGLPANLVPKHFSKMLVAILGGKPL